MSHKLLGCIYLLIIFNVSFSQNCNCSQNFTAVQLSVEKNYAGFTDKVNTKTKAQYNSMVKQLTNEALAANNEKSCYNILKKYVQFYKDGHLQLSTLPENMVENIQYQLLPENVELYFKNKDITANIQGIYTSENYELAIVPHATQKNTYVGIVISSKNENWKQGMIKMVLTPVAKNYYNTIFFYGDFEKTETEAYFAGNVLDILAVGIFDKKLTADEKNKLPSNYESVFPKQDISFSFPNNHTAILFLGSFQNMYEQVIDSLMTVHKQALEKRPNWIIDLRYNGGGGTGTYKSILPYLFTNAIKRSGSYYWLSTEHIAKYETALAENPNWPQKVKNAFENYIKIGKVKPNSWHYEAGNTYTFNKIQPNPKKIMVLTSKNTASSAEIFLMDAKQSKKVTIIGSTTAGVVDYGDGNNFTIGCSKLYITIPARKSAYLKYQSFDNVGIKPNIICNAKDALQIAMQQLK
jgi:hypothetical protein